MKSSFSPSFHHEAQGNKEKTLFQGEQQISKSHYCRRRLVLLIAQWSTVDSIIEPSAAAPAEKRNDGEDETRAERAKKSAMAAQANTTQGATTTVAQHSGGPCSSPTWSLGRTIWR